MWQPEASTTVGDALNTPDISSIVTEITSQSDWAAGNSLAILFGHTSGSGARWVESFSLQIACRTTAKPVQFGHGYYPPAANLCVKRHRLYLAAALPLYRNKYG